MDDCLGSLDHVESVQHDRAFFAKGVEVLGALRQRARDGHLLVIISKLDVVMLEKSRVLEEPVGEGNLANHVDDEEDG